MTVILWLLMSLECHEHFLVLPDYCLVTPELNLGCPHCYFVAPDQSLGCHEHFLVDPYYCHGTLELRLGCNVILWLPISVWDAISISRLLLITALQQPNYIWDGMTVILWLLIRVWNAMSISWLLLIIAL